MSGVDPSGLGTITLTGGGSAIVVGGGEGNGGVYISNKPFDLGFILTGGAGGGGNVGLSAQLGYITGPLSNVSDPTVNYNASALVGSGTLVTDPTTGNVVGGTIGPAGSIGGSVTYSQSGTYGLSNLMVWVK